MVSHSTTSPRVPTAPAFLALACVGFLATAPAAHAARDGTGSDIVPVAPTATDEDASQDRQTRQERPEIVVNGQRQDTELSSPRATRPLVDTPQTVTVLSEETLRQQNLLTLRDALSIVPGITFGAGEGGGGYGDSINLRGYSASNDMTVDGMRDSGQYTRSDPFNLESIEIYSGANSVNAGAGGVGGTINLVQKRPIEQSRTVIEAGVGTDDYYRATIDTNQRVSDFIALRLNAMYHENDAPGLDVVRYKRWGVAPSVTFGIGGPTSLTLSYLHQEDDNIPVYGVPYYPALGGLLPGAEYSGYYGYANIDSQTQTVDQATVRFVHDFSDTTTLTALGRWQRVEANTIVNPPQGTYCLASGVTQAGVACGTGQVPGMYYPSGPRGTARYAETQTLFGQVDLRTEFATGPLAHTLVVGFSATQEDYDLRQGNVQRNADGSSVSLPPISISDPDTLYTGPVNFILSSHQQGDVTNIAGFLADTIAVASWLDLNASLRVERNDGSFRSDTIATPAAGGGITASQLGDSGETLVSYRAGIVAKPTPETSVYFAYGNSQTPSQATVRLGCVSSTTNYCDAAPEKAESYEIGAKASLMGGRLLLTAAVFRNERTNYRVTSYDPLSPSEQVLDGRARVDGIALGASGNITPNWAVFANYTYLDSEVLQSVSNYCVANPGVGSCPLTDPQAGNPLTSTPDHSGSLFTTYTLPFGLQIGYGLTYQGSYTILSTDANLRADDFLIHRAFASMHIGPAVTVQLNVQNLTDEKYYTGIRNSASGWAVPGEGRSARLSLFYSF